MIPFEDFYGYENFGGSDVSAMFALDFVWPLILPALGLVLLQYVLQSVGLYTIAQRRRIRHAWLAWIPVGSDWLLGCISDQYQYVAKAKNKRKRVAMLVLSVLIAGLGVWLIVDWTRLIVEIVTRYQELLLYKPAGLILQTMELLGVLSALWCVSVIFWLVRITALYNLYASSVPGDRVIYLLLSIFINACIPILVFACRKWDLGMPSRKSVVFEAEEP